MKQRVDAFHHGQTLLLSESGPLVSEHLGYLSSPNLQFGTRFLESLHKSKFWDQASTRCVLLVAPPLPLLPFHALVSHPLLHTRPSIRSSIISHPGTSHVPPTSSARLTNILSMSRQSHPHLGAKLTLGRHQRYHPLSGLRLLAVFLSSTSLTFQLRHGINLPARTTEILPLQTTLVMT